MEIFWRIAKHLSAHHVDVEVVEVLDCSAMDVSLEEISSKYVTKYLLST